MKRPNSRRGIPTKVGLHSQRRLRPFHVLACVICLGFMIICYHQFHIFPLEETKPLQADNIVEVSPLDPFPESASVNFDQCDWIKLLLQHGPTLGEALPEPGQTRAGGTFWLKKPLKHTSFIFDSIPTFPKSAKKYFSSQLDYQDAVEIMILHYNVYNKKWTQHTNKFTNTVNTLQNTTLTSLSLFPKLYGKCVDLDGFHTIAVEYIPFEMNQLRKPTNLEECISRANTAIDTFQQLHSLDLVLVDMKKGQWMSRREGQIVLQDVDDIVKTNSPGAYDNQIEWFQNILKSDGVKDVQSVWEEMFPNGKLNEKYNILGTDVLLNDLGFSWSRNCKGTTTTFNKCFKKLLKWTRKVPSLPTFEQIKDRLSMCYSRRNQNDLDFSAFFD